MTEDNRSSNGEHDTAVNSKKKISGFFGGKNGMVEQGWKLKRDSRAMGDEV